MAQRREMASKHPLIIGHCKNESKEISLINALNLRNAGLVRGPSQSPLPLLDTPKVRGPEYQCPPPHPSPYDKRKVSLSRSIWEPNLARKQPYLEQDSYH